MTDTHGLLMEVLAEYGPMSEDDIAQRLTAQGVIDTEAAIRHALHLMNCPAVQLPDNRWMWLPTAAAGRVFTHRLNRDEVTHDVLTMSPDLDPISDLFEFEPHNHFADGSPTLTILAGFDDELLDERGIPEESVPDSGVLALPPGTLRTLGMDAGDLVGLRFSTEGFTVERVGTVTEPDLGARLKTQVSPDEPVNLNAAVWSLYLQDPTLFTKPTPPLAESITNSSLEYQVDLLAHKGFDFDAWRFELQCTALAQAYELEPDEALAVWTLVTRCEQFADLLALADSDDLPEHPEAGGPAHPPLTDCGALLADPYLAQVLQEQTIDRGIHPAALGLLTETLEAQVPRPARVACRWLRAVALERSGATEEAEREFLAAESMDTDWPPTLLDLARFAADRGDTERALALLRRAGAPPDHPLFGLLEKFRPPARPDHGRNDPCYCGSGRKYKKCHLGNEQLPLAERAAWLYAKACQHVLLSGWLDLLDEVALERAQYLEDPDEHDPLIMDAVLFEGGAFVDFLGQRGYLLPDDERLLAEQWLLVDRSVFEVEESRPGDGLTVRDLRTGDRHDVLDKLASRQLKPGHLVCTRVLPAGDTMRFLGGLEPVALYERDELTALLDDEPDPAELVEFLSRRFGALTLTNTEGHLVVICETTLRVTDPTSLRTALDVHYERQSGIQQWIEHVTVHGMQHIRSSMDLDGDTLRVNTDSTERMNDILAALAVLDPAMSVVDEVRLPASNARDLANQEPFGEDDLDPADPEIQALLDTHVRAYEANWVDQPIPALNGVTPRQAADDPTRRGDLMKLLDSFPTDVRGTMNVDRLRAALGLT